MSLLRRAGTRIAGMVGGASSYLDSVLVAVLLAPVLPDIVLDLFGAPTPGWRNPALRVAAITLVLLACIGAHQFRRWRARRREMSAPISELGHYEVLVQPLSLSGYDYRPRATDRPRNKSVPEVNVDGATPRLVVAVATPKIPAVSRDELRVGLEKDDVDFDVIVVDESYDVKLVVPEVTEKVLAKLREREIDPSDVCFDTTGGNVPMSLAMLRAAALYGSRCCYVSSERDPDTGAYRNQRSRSFDPTELFAAPE